MTDTEILEEIIEDEENLDRDREDFLNMKLDHLADVLESNAKDWGTAGCFIETVMAMIDKDWWEREDKNTNITLS